MSSTSSPASNTATLRDLAKLVMRRLKQAHVPVVGFTLPFFKTLYLSHIALRESSGWLARFCWYEPLFRSQCHRVGCRFRMEQLPYIVGSGLINIGDDVQFSGKPSFTFSSRYTDRPSLSIGTGSFLGHGCGLIVGRSISIGSHCLIASAVRMSDFDGHPLDATQRRNGLPALAQDVHPIRIGNDVWIGHAATILKGVQIGDRAIVGAHAVVTHDVAADTVIAGNPARCVKSLPTASEAE